MWRIIFISVCALLSALLCAIYLEAVPVADDLWFSVPGADGSPLAERLIAAASLTMERWQTDMIRLPNQTTALLLALPRWITALLIFACCTLSLEAGRRLAETSFRAVTSYLWVTAFFICLPWYDYLISTSYALNYLLSTTFALWTALLFIRACRPGGGGTGIGALALAFLAGWCHEGFSAPLLCGMIVMIFCIRITEKRYTSESLCIAAVTTLGTGVIFLSPVFGSRAAQAMLLTRMPFWEAAVQIGPSLLLLIVTICAATPLLYRRFMRPRLLMLLTMSIAAETVALLFYSGPRTTWAAELYSLVTLFSLPGLYGWKRRRPVILISATAVLTAMTAASLIAGIIAQRKLTAEMQEVIALYRKSPDGQIFYDITGPRMDMTLMKTTVRALNERVPLGFISQYESKRRGKYTPIRILPAQLKGFRADSCEREGLTVYRGYVVGTDSIAICGRDLQRRQIMLDGDIATRYNPVPFTTADGKRAFWLNTHAQLINPGMHVTSAVFL